MEKTTIPTMTAMMTRMATTKKKRRNCHRAVCLACLALAVVLRRLTLEHLQPVSSLVHQVLVQQAVCLDQVLVQAVLAWQQPQQQQQMRKEMLP